jgi:hypothetical protein
MSGMPMKNMSMKSSSTRRVSMKGVPTTRVSEGPLFPPLKNGGRGDLLFMSEQSKSLLPPFFQRGRPWLQGVTQ